MYSSQMRCLILAVLTASDHLILLHSQQVPPDYTESPPIPSTSSINYGLIGLAIVFISAITVGLCWIFFVCTPQRKSPGETSQGPDVKNPPPKKQRPRSPASPPPRVFKIPHLPKEFKDYEELRSATGGFSESNVLGQGGFGTVYRGVLPPDGETVAIKKLSPHTSATRGEQEFRTEVETISRAHHRHIVSLVGYYIGLDEAHKEVKMLVYEYIPNNSLYSHLHGTETIDWQRRLKIAIGSAKGLTYLHEGCKPKIIHRDIKAANILIDNNFEPKIADFGVAKLSSDTDTHVTTTRLKGTIGYLAPEYASSGRLTEKADVFSFGVVLLELITGRKPLLQTGSLTKDSLVEWARPLLSTALVNRKFEVLADPKLQNNYNSEEMFRMASCAANCVRHSADRRPRMSQVVDALEGKIPLDNRDEVSPQDGGEFLNMFRKMALNEVDGSSSCQTA